jgi:hypothetical protein
MELLLNLLWLMLTVPAVWLLRPDPTCARSSRCRGGLCPALLLGCILVLLFPVISVTDDLHAMRPEMEESSPSRRAIRQSAGDRSQSGSSGLGTFPSEIVCLFSFLPSNEACEHILTKPVRLPEEAQLATCSSRAPPLSKFS